MQVGVHDSSSAPGEAHERILSKFVEFFAKPGMSNPDQGFGSFPDGFTVQAGDAVLGHDITNKAGRGYYPGRRG